MVVHPTAYDGCVELGAMQSNYAVVGGSSVDVNYKCANEIVKTHLLQACFDMLNMKLDENNWYNT